MKTIRWGMTSDIIESEESRIRMSYRWDQHAGGKCVSAITTSSKIHPASHPGWRSPAFIRLGLSGWRSDERDCPPSAGPVWQSGELSPPPITIRLSVPRSRGLLKRNIKISKADSDKWEKLNANSSSDINKYIASLPIRLKQSAEKYFNAGVSVSARFWPLSSGSVSVMEQIVRKKC